MREMEELLGDGTVNLVLNNIFQSVSSVVLNSQAPNYYDSVVYLKFEIIKKINLYHSS